MLNYSHLCGGTTLRFIQTAFIIQCGNFVISCSIIIPTCGLPWPTKIQLWEALSSYLYYLVVWKKLNVSKYIIMEETLPVWFAKNLIFEQKCPAREIFCCVSICLYIWWSKCRSIKQRSVTCFLICCIWNEWAAADFLIFMDNCGSFNRYIDISIPKKLIFTDC